MTNSRTVLALGWFAAVASVTLVAGQNQAPIVEHSFDSAPVAAPPAGFTFSAMRRAEPGSWLVRRTGTNGYLVHPAQQGGRGYSMAIMDGEALVDQIVSARIRLAGGALRAGVISRYQDGRNYYVTVLDLDQGQLRQTRVFDGNHSRIEFKEDLQLDASAWHALRIIHHEDWVYTYLGGIRVFEDRDSRNRAFGAGRAGVMAFANSEAWFDDLAVGPEPAPKGRSGRR